MKTLHVPDMSKNSITTLLSVMVICYSVVSIFRSLYGTREKERVSLTQSYGRIVAEEMASSIPLSADVLVLGLNAPLNPGIEEMANRLTRALRTHGYTQVSEMILHGEEPLPTVILDGHHLSVPVFKQVLSQHPNAEVIVSMAGTPPADAEILRLFTDRSMKLVLAGNSAPGSHLDLWMQSGHVALAVLPHRATPSTLTKPPDTERQVFDFYFEIH